MAQNTKLYKDIAADLTKAEESRTPIPPIAGRLKDGGLADAYAIQEINTKAALAAGRRLVGRKIGLTSKAVQAQLGVDQPDFGMLFADMALAEGEEVAAGRLIQPKAEGEVAFVLGRDIDVEQPTIADVINAVAYALPAIEIVDSRIADWKIGILDTVADNASSGLYVLGAEPRGLAGLDLRRAGMVMERRGEPTAFGAGAACLGHPLVATLWLAKTMIEVGRPLAAGDVVLSGALGPMAPVEPGDDIELRISGLGSVRAFFAAE